MLHKHPMYACIPAKDVQRARDKPGQRSQSGAVTAGGAKAAWFKDSEGNIMAIIQDA